MKKKTLLRSLAAFSLLAVGGPLAVNAAGGGIQWIQNPQHAKTDEGSGKYETIAASKKTLDFNKKWSFKEVNEDQFESLKPYETEFNDDSWTSVNLPYDWAIYKDFDPDVSATVGHLLGGYGWYRKVFFVPEALKGKKITITFNGVYMESTTYVNGKKLGFFPNGYAPFSYDLTPYLNYGSIPNVIAVSAVNTDGTSRWYSGAGIYRDVTLTVQEQVHLEENGTVLTFPDLKKNHEANPQDFSATTHVVSTLVNDSLEDVTVQVRHTVLDYQTGLPVSEAVAVTSDPVTLKSGKTSDIGVDVLAKNPKLWSPDAPNLYAMKTEILKNGEVIETSTQRFGYRYFDWYSKVEADAGKGPGVGFFLNGKSFFFNGVCLHHDQGALGADANPNAIFRQLSVMKEMGVNALRITHNVADPALLRACDELGIVTIEEFFDSWYTPKASRDFARFFENDASKDFPGVAEGTTWAQYLIQSVIKRDRNVPSIIMWSVGNEIPDSHDFSSDQAQEKAVKTIKNLVSWAHGADVDDGSGNDRVSAQRRFVTIGQNPSNPTAIPIMNELDAVGYNYWFQYGKDSQGREVYDNWRWYGSETASAVSSRGFFAQGGGEQTQYAYVDGFGEQLSSWDNSSVPWGATASYELKRQQTSPNIAGEFVWTGFDYGGEPTPWYSDSGYRSPVKSYFGIVDTAGFAKDDYYLYQSQWKDVNTDPMVHIVSHFNWEDQTLRNQFAVDGKIPLKVYSNAQSVELFRQKPGEEPVSLGVKNFVDKTATVSKTSRAYQRSEENPDVLYLRWDVDWTYEPGTRIFAKAYYGVDGQDEIPHDKLNQNKHVAGLNVGQSEIVTAGAPAKVELHVQNVKDAYGENDTAVSDDYDLVYVDAKVVDKDGNFVPTAMNTLDFQYVGDPDVAEIVGTDNGDAASWERYKGYEQADGTIDWRRSAFNGRALAIVKTKEKAGAFALQVTAPGLKGDTVMVKVDGLSADAVSEKLPVFVDTKKRIA